MPSKSQSWHISLQEEPCDELYSINAQNDGLARPVHMNVKPHDYTDWLELSK